MVVLTTTSLLDSENGAIEMVPIAIAYGAIGDIVRTDGANRVYRHLTDIGAILWRPCTNGAKSNSI
jgi:hypothetical protein